MIPKRSASKSRAPRRREPVNVELTVRFNFGQQPEDAVTVIDHRRIPMVDSVFRSRDAILRGFVSLLVKAGLKQPAVVRELIPFTRKRASK
ncbi:MAG TPA: hypothetical protein VHE37_09595 [Nevskiaceae bacterium]|nr:hypothetical protein [Nevskiaceae bacterium]